LTLQIGAEEVDPEELDRLTRQLRTDIEELDIESVALAKGTAPQGAKSGDLVSIGALVIQLAPTALPGLVHLLQGWMQRGSGRDVKVDVHSGDKSVHVEYSPAQMSQTDVATLVSGLMGALEERSKSEG
jgi:hypothetical protein